MKFVGFVGFDKQNIEFTWALSLTESNNIKHIKVYLAIFVATVVRSPYPSEC